MMTPDSLVLVGIAGLIALLAESGVLYAAVGLAGGEYVEERNSFLTAVFITIAIGIVGLGLRVLLLQGAISRTTAGLIIVPSWFLAVMLTYRLGLIRGLLVLIVQAFLGFLIFAALTFFARVSGLFSGLGRILPPG